MDNRDSRFKIDHAPLWRTVTNQLRMLILAGDIPAGIRLVETELAHRMGVSRGPVRQALMRLEQEGFVQILPRQGTYVVELTPELVSEKYELRRLLEEYAVRLAACQCTAKDLGVLKEYCAQMGQAVETQDFEGFYTSQYRFHRAIVSMAGMETLLKLWDLLGMGIGSLMMLNLYYANSDEAFATRIWESDVALTIVTGHEELTEVIAGCDRDKAVAAMHQHLCAGEKSVLNALEIARRAWQSKREARTI